MSEYDQLCRILDREFKTPNQNLMIESKGTQHKVQRVRLDGNGRRNLVYTLFRFDLEEKEFLPFFNKTDDSPEGLRKFCDYILLVEASNKSYVMLIELKRGDVGLAEKQLKASECFMEYIYSSAERLHQDFGDVTFNRRNITLLKIKLKKCKSNKRPTKSSLIDKTQEFITFESVGDFPIAHFL